jgi:predicted MFS family arabinose efflux permease
MQQEVSAEQLSRVYSYDALGSFVVIPLGAAIAGPVAEHIGTAETLTGSALLILVATTLVLLIGDVRNLCRKPVEVAEAVSA